VVATVLVDGAVGTDAVGAIVSACSDAVDSRPITVDETFARARTRIRSVFEPSEPLASGIVSIVTSTWEAARADRGRSARD
jgi:hypothetical protein